MGVWRVYVAIMWTCRGHQLPGPGSCPGQVAARCALLAAWLRLRSLPCLLPAASSCVLPVLPPTACPRPRPSCAYYRLLLLLLLPLPPTASSASASRLRVSAGNGQ
jgi:hypothetical protein